jgi:hypothetical protein
MRNDQQQGAVTIKVVSFQTRNTRAAEITPNWVLGNFFLRNRHQINILAQGTADFDVFNTVAGFHR